MKQAATFAQALPTILSAHQTTRRTDALPGTLLRILPLGDSITWGYLSSDGNGYRLPLQQNLAGSDLVFIGSQRAGNMTNNENEGHPGATINQIAGYAKNNSALPARPNIVLLHAGTNDLNGVDVKDPYDAAPERLGTLIDEIVDACPDAAVLVAKIINAANSTTESRIQTFNAQVPVVVAQRADKGEKVMAVDMTSIGVNDLKDGLHPTDEGYRRMGDIWFKAIQTVVKNGWVSEPVDVGSVRG